jgi:hypothetical protein
MAYDTVNSNALGAGDQLSLHDPSTDKKYTIDLNSGHITIVDKNGHEYVQRFPAAEVGKKEFGHIIDQIGKKTGEMPLVIEGGINELLDVIDGTASVMETALKFAKTSGKVIKKIAGKLPLLGAAAAYTDGEAKIEEIKLLNDLGIISDDACSDYISLMDKYKKTGVTGEWGAIAAQKFYHNWSEEYNLPRYLLNELRPDSLLVDLLINDTAPRPDNWTPDKVNPYENYAVQDSSRLPIDLTTQFNFSVEQPAFALNISGTELRTMLTAIPENKIAAYGPEMNALWQMRELPDMFADEFDTYKTDPVSLEHLSNDVSAVQAYYQDALRNDAGQKQYASAENTQTNQLNTLKM